MEKKKENGSLLIAINHNKQLSTYYKQHKAFRSISFSQLAYLNSFLFCPRPQHDGRKEDYN